MARSFLSEQLALRSDGKETETYKRTLKSSDAAYFFEALTDTVGAFFWAPLAEKE